MDERTLNVDTVPAERAPDTNDTSAHDAETPLQTPPTSPSPHDSHSSSVRDEPSFDTDALPAGVTKQRPESSDKDGAYEATDRGVFITARAPVCGVPVCADHASRPFYALLVGCDYPGSRYMLNQCVNDVRKMQQGIIDACAPQANTGACERRVQLKVLVDRKRKEWEDAPTKKNILKALDEWLVPLVNEADGRADFLIYISGHGTQVRCTAADKTELDGMDEAYCPTDMDTAGLITDNEWRAALSKITNPLARGHFQTDICHSGSMVDARYNYTLSLSGHRLVREDARRQVYDGLPPELCFRMTSMGSCRDFETSSELSNTGGAATDAMVSVIREWRMASAKKDDCCMTISDFFRKWTRKIETMHGGMLAQRPVLQANFILDQQEPFIGGVHAVIPFH